MMHVLACCVSGPATPRPARLKLQRRAGAPGMDTAWTLAMGLADASQLWCRPGWGELLAIVALVLCAGYVGCCCGVGWGAALAHGLNSSRVPPAPALGHVLAKVAARRLKAYHD